jgi:hypothetical protein
MLGDSLDLMSRMLDSLGILVPFTVACVVLMTYQCSAYHETGIGQRGLCQVLRLFASEAVCRCICCNLTSQRQITPPNSIRSPAADVGGTEESRLYKLSFRSRMFEHPHFLFLSAPRTCSSIWRTETSTNK